MVREALRFVFKGTLESDDIKNQERLNLWSSIEQAESNKGNRQPVLVFKRNRSKTYAVIDFVHFIELINKNIKDK